MQVRDLRPAGCHVFGRTSSRLYTPTVKLPNTEWVLTPEAFEPIVDQATFSRAQLILQSRTINNSDEDLLDHLRELLVREKRLSLRIIQNSPDAPSPSTYRHRFGSLRRAYELIGYGQPENFGPIDLRRRTQAMRNEMISRIAAMFPRDVSVVCRGGRWRSRLRMRNGVLVAVLVARSIRVWKSAIRWCVDPVKHERRCVTLLVRLNESNDSFLDFHIFHEIERQKRFRILRDDSWLNRALPVGDLSEFSKLVTEARAAGAGTPSRGVYGDRHRSPSISSTPVRES